MYKNSALYAPGSAGKSDIVVVALESEVRLRRTRTRADSKSEKKLCLVHRDAELQLPLCHSLALTLYFRCHRECTLLYRRSQLKLGCSSYFGKHTGAVPIK
jgi:hypothetical protein